MKRIIYVYVLCLVTVVMMAGTVSAGPVPLTVSGVTGSNGGNWGPWAGHLTDMCNGNLSYDFGDQGVTGHLPNMDISANFYAPSTWKFAGGGYAAEFSPNSGELLDPTTTLNQKILWAVFDLGSVIPAVDNMYIWNRRDKAGTGDTAEYNIYYSSGSGIAALPAMPQSKQNRGDYDFSSGDWTLFNGGGPLTLAKNAANNSTPQTNIVLGGISARYVAIEILKRATDAPVNDKLGASGLAQVEFSIDDTTPPTLSPTDITNNVGSSVEVYNPVTYTLTFNEAIRPESVTSGVFSAGISISIDSISQTASNVFDVVVVPTAEGSLTLQVSSNVLDLGGNTLAANVTDDETITVGSDSTAPTVVSIVDSRGGGPMGAGQSITYTVTFNEHIDDTSVAIGDFVNASSTVMTVTSVTTGALASIFLVDVTPDDAGFIRLQVANGSILDKSANANNVAWNDDDVVTVASSDPADGTWAVDANGEWGEVSNWQGNIVARGADRTATFPNIIGSDRTVTLDAGITIGNITAADANKNYTISGANTLTLDVTTGTPAIDVTTSGRTLTINTVIGGNDGLHKNGAGRLQLSGNNTYSGGTVVNSGELRFNSDSALGDTSSGVTISNTARFVPTVNNITVAATRTITVASGAIAVMGDNSLNSNPVRLYVDGMITGQGGIQTGHYQLGSGQTYLRNTSNDFEGPVIMGGSSLTGINWTYSTFGLNVASLGDGVGYGNIIFGPGHTGAGKVATFSWSSVAIAPLILNNRQVELDNGDDYGKLSSDNGNTANTITVNTDLLVTTTASTVFILGGSNTGDNTFAGSITNGVGSLSLRKDNGGTWILSGVNTYTGTTIVNSGKLVLKGQQSVSDSGTVNIAGGKVEVEVQEKVAALQFNGTPSAPATGTWGSSTSGAENQNDTYFTGDGMLYVGVDFPPQGTVIIIR